MQEIERKYLVVGDFQQGVQQVQNLKQAYLSVDPARTVRIRIQDDQAFITIKGASQDGGLSRFEWEKSIPKEEAEQLLKLAVTNPIQKKRYRVLFSKQLFEVDVFEGANQGLQLAEIELKNSNQKVLCPDWLGAEVTGDKRYYNAYLAQHPFSTWESDSVSFVD